MWLLVFQRMATEFLWDFLYFPIWWYTVGAKRALLFCVRFFLEGNASLAPLMWLKNIFVPMFGQYDWQGRLMSIFMRFVNFVGRSIGLFIWLLIVIAMFVIWLLLPAFILYMFFISLL